MKRISTIYLIILGLLFLGGLVLEQCNEYSKERTLWKIQNDFKKINRPKHAENEFIVKKIIGRYEEFIRKYPNSEVTSKANMSLADTFISLERFQEGREIYNHIVDKYNINANIVAQAKYALAKSFEIENNWPKAITIYRAIIREHPLTQTGFSIPFYLGNFYATRGLHSTAISAFREAVEFYENIFSNYPESDLGFSSLQMLVKCHIALGMWVEAFYSARRLLFEYPLAASQVNTIQLMYSIGVQKLRNPKLVLVTYNEFLRKNPGHPIKPALERLTRKLQLESSTQ